MQYISEDKSFYAQVHHGKGNAKFSIQILRIFVGRREPIQDDSKLIFDQVEEGNKAAIDQRSCCMQDCSTQSFIILARPCGVYCIQCCYQSTRAVQVRVWSLRHGKVCTPKATLTTKAACVVLVALKLARRYKLIS